MGLKKGKYVYIKLSNGKYVKVRVIKSKAEDVPERYIPVGPIVKKPPLTAKVIKEEELPENVREHLSKTLMMMPT